ICSPFLYSGCQANANNFETLEECRTTCNPDFTVRITNFESEPVTTNPVCYEPKKVGPCRAYVPRYFYNTTTKFCERFIYGGCQGNRNNFPELDVCLEDLARASPPCATSRRTRDLASATSPRYYYNTTTNTCEQFIYGGCKGNANNFETLLRCESKCGNVSLSEEIIRSKLLTKLVTHDALCELPVTHGPCRGHMIRYYYDTTANSCEEFVYGGCEGNPNNFQTLQDCETRCGGNSTIEFRPWRKHTTKPLPLDDVIRANPVLSRETVGLKPVCNETKYPGPCAGYFPRYYFNNVTRSCEKFIYGGCQGNGNNFQTLEECQNTCWASLDQHPLKIVGAFEVPIWPFTPPEVCTYAADAGPCEAYMRRFFYNTLTKACEQFVYGGCGGNGNNFLTYDACQKKCKTVFGVVPRA
ncbi:hypothetical protein MTO96_007531, partial [Rhipicephalus appendiculatus]